MPTIHARPVAKTRILIADDEPSIRAVLSDLLLLEGYDVEVAVDGRDALDRIQAERFDILLTDMEMPRMNGIELVTRLGEMHGSPLPIFMTGYGTVDTAVKAMKSGVWDYLLKPFQIDNLVAILRRAVQHLELTRENLRLKAGEALFVTTQQLMERQTSEHAYVEILAHGLQDALGAESVRIFLRSRDNAAEMPQFRQLVHVGRAEPLDWLGPNLYVEANLTALQSRLQQAGSLILEPDQLRTIFLNPPAHADFAVLITPLRDRSEVFGYAVASRSLHHPFVEGDARAAQILASRAASALMSHALVENIEATFLETIRSLINALEAKDEYTKGHSMRVSRWAVLIGRELQLDERMLQQVQTAALLHDIGKIGMNLEMINKREKLTSAEYEYFKLHPTLGKNILEPVSFLRPMLPMVQHHHERMDGGGYPHGLAGEAIPLGARIIGVADAWEVMITDRVYRPAMSYDDARAELIRCTGGQFDPDVSQALLRVLAPYGTLAELPVKGGRKGEAAPEVMSNNPDLGVSLRGLGEKTMH